MPDNLEVLNISWHPGFYGAAELEFLSNKGDLEFQREYNLSKEPIRMDLLIIKKLSDVRIENELGHIFKKFNVYTDCSNKTTRERNTPYTACPVETCTGRGCPGIC